MFKTAFIYHQDYLLHDTGSLHPERSDRLKSIVTYLQSTNLAEKLKWIKPGTDVINHVSTWIEKNHSKDYIEFVKKACESGREVLDFGDTHVCKDSYRIALLAVGGVLLAVDEIAAGKVKNAFCAVRPPGHHARYDSAMGFCLFNNIAIAARYAQEKYNLRKILIVDWDVHHGNGTQESFYGDNSIFYFSTHQYPYYPGTGSLNEIGVGEGKGFTLNMPLRAGSGDSEYIDIFKNKLVPSADNFKPDFIMISAGFDAHKDDPLAGMELSDEGYVELTKIIKEIAEKYCQGRILSVLEGGYNLDALARSIYKHIEILDS
jgi:acetoin utilization deacetylase AcuC-like enzyme